MWQFSELNRKSLEFNLNTRLKSVLFQPVIVEFITTDHKDENGELYTGPGKDMGPREYDSQTELCCGPSHNLEWTICNQQEPAAAKVKKRARTEHVLQVPQPRMYVDGVTTWWELGERKVPRIRSTGAGLTPL